MAFQTKFILLFSVLVNLDNITTHLTPEVEELQGISDYRSVILTWKYGKRAENGFIVRYCEIGRDTRRQLCAMKILNESDNNVLTVGDNNPRRYSTIIDGLRLSTRYYFDVIPMTSNQQTAYLLSANGQPESFRTDSFQAVSTGLYIATRDFRAKVTKCMKEFSEIEIDTGPYFGGIIEVEGAADPRCSLKGDKNNILSKYILIITHKLCGSRSNGRFVENIVLANENPNVITQSSRRFNVVCDVIPENHTLHTVINVPLENAPSPNPPPMIGHQYSPLENEIRNEKARMLERNFEESINQTSSEGSGQLQLIIVGAMLVTALLIIFMAAWLWWRHRRKGSSDSAVDRAHIIPTNENHDSSDYATNNNNNNTNTTTNNNNSGNQETDVSLTSHRILHMY